MTARPSRRRSPLLAVAAALGLATLGATAGCYDAAALRKERQEATSVARLEEVDLGAYRVTLPHKLGVAIDRVVDFHAFGQVARRHRSTVAKALELRSAELRAQMLLELRGLPAVAYEEPKLIALRQKIADVINGALDDKLVKQVGFYHYTFDVVE